ncbi:MAG: YncE family protein, partial [Candidatus Bipolaricaulia bacterium]
IETGSKQNYTEITPDGRYLVNAARFTDTYQLIGADPSHPDFGTVVAQYNTYANAGPCDMTIREDGRYAFDPDRHSDAIAVLDLNSFEVVAVVPVEPLVGDRPDPFMGTISPDGRFFFVENTEGDGTESVWDVSDPLNPVELKRFTQQDGLGLGSLTDEFTPDGRFNFIINRSSSDLNVVDLNSLEIVDTIAFPPGSNPVTGDFSVDGHKFYVTLPGRDAVAVIDVAEQRVIDTVKVGPQPVGVIAQRTTVPETAGVDRPLGLAYQTGRQFDENCPFACCGKV